MDSASVGGPSRVSVYRPLADADTSPSTPRFRSVRCFLPHLDASQKHSQGSALRLRGGGINIVADDDDADDSDDDEPALHQHPQGVEDEDEDDYEDEEDEDEDHDGDYEDEDEDEDDDEESPVDSAVDDDDGGLEYADNPEVVHAYQQEERLRYQQQGWTPDQHREYTREQYAREHQQYWQQQQHQRQQQQPPQVITLEPYAVDEEEEGEVVYHQVEDTSYKRARRQEQQQEQQQKASTSRAPLRHVVTPHYPRDQFGSQPYDPNEEDEEVIEVEEDLDAFLRGLKKTTPDDEDMPHDDEPQDPHPLGDTENWLSQNAVTRWADNVARRDKLPGAPKPIFSDMGEHLFKDALEKRRQEEIKAREPVPFRQDARTIRQEGFDPVQLPVVPGAATPMVAVVAAPATPPPGPPRVFPVQGRRGREDEPFVQALPTPRPQAGGLASSSPMPSPVAAPSALSMSLSMGTGGQYGVYPGYSPGTAQQQLPPSLPQPLFAHHHRRQQQQHAGQQEAWVQSGLSAHPVAMPVLQRQRGRSRSVDSSRSPSLAVRQAASSADYRAAKLRQELKKSLQQQEEKTRVQEAEKRARARVERGVQTGSRADGSATVRTARTREEQAEHRARSGKGKEKASEDHPSPTTSITGMPPSTHRPLPVVRSYRSRRIGTNDLAALRPAALNFTARPSVGVDDRAVQSTATSAATSTTSLLLGGSGSELAALENWTPLERPPAEGGLQRSATASSNVSPQAMSPVTGHSPSGSGSRGASGSRGHRGTTFAAAVVHPAVAAAFQGTNPHFYAGTWGYKIVGGNKKSPSSQSKSDDEEAQPAERKLDSLPGGPIHQQSSAPQTQSSSPRPPMPSWVNRAFGFNSSSTQPTNTEPSQSSGAAEANGSTGRRRSATNPNPNTIPRTPTAAQLLLHQSGYAQTGNLYGREREWKRNGGGKGDRDGRAPRRQDFQSGGERERDRNRGDAEEGSPAALPQQPQPPRALQRQQEGQSSFRAHDQFFRSNQRQGQTRQRPSAGDDNGALVSDGGSVESGDLNMDAGYPVEHGASARTRAGGRDRRRDDGACGKSAAGATIPDADLEPTTVLEPQSARSTRFPTPVAINATPSPPSPSYPDASGPGSGRKPRVRNGDFYTIDSNPNSRASTQPSSVRPTQPAARTAPRGFPLIVPPIQRRNRLAEGGSSHPSQRLAYSFTGPQTPSTSLLAASHFLGVNPARLTGGNRSSEYGEDYDAHDLFSQDGGSVHSAPSDSVARGRPALRANA